MTPPVEVITTTIITCGWSSSTSMWRIVEVSIGGAVTIASRFVTCESVSVGDPHRLVELAANQRQRQPRRGVLRRQQPIDEVAIAGLGGNASRGRVRMREQAQLLEAGQLGPDRRWAPLDVHRQRLRADGRSDFEVFLDDLAQHELLA